MEGVRFIPCKICSAPSTGFHFGALTCEACKAFFRRVLKSGATLDTLICSGQDPSATDGPSQSNGQLPTIEGASNSAQGGEEQPKRCNLAFSPKKCPKCRYRRCLEVGMGPSASKIGRPTKGRVAEVREELHKIKPFLGFKEGNIDAEDTSGDLVSMSAHSSSLQHILENKESRKRSAVYGDINAKRRHPSVPTNVYYGSGGSLAGTSAGMQAADYAAHVRHFSGDMFDPRYRPSRFTVGDYDFDDGEEDDDLEDSMNLYPEQQQKSTFPPGQQQSPLFASLAHPQPLSNFAALNGESNKPPTVADAERPALPTGSSATSSSQQPLAAIITVIQQYNNSGGNRQRFVQSLRELGADREGSSLAWLYQSADQWFDLANVMFQSPLAVSNLLSAAQASNAPSQSGSLDQFKVASTSSTSATVQRPSSNGTYLPQHPLSQVPSTNSQASPLLGASVFSPFPQALRSEAVARQVVNATKHLANLNLQRQSSGPGSLNLASPDTWGFLTQNFNSNTAHIDAFARAIPGFSMVQSATDQALLSMNAFLPLLFINMSIDFDPVTENIRLHWTPAQSSDDDLSSSRSVLRAPQEVAAEPTSSGRMNTLTVVEFSFLCALIYFNPATRGLQDPIGVDIVSSELTTSSEYFINSNFPSNKTSPPNSALSAAVGVAFPSGFGVPTTNGMTQLAGDVRLTEFRRLLSHFRNLNASNCRVPTEIKVPQQQPAASASSVTEKTEIGSAHANTHEAAIREMYQKMVELMANLHHRHPSAEQARSQNSPPNGLVNTPASQFFQQLLISRMANGDSRQ